jgi:hypothetical protein
MRSSLSHFSPSLPANVHADDAFSFSTFPLLLFFVASVENEARSMGTRMCGSRGKDDKEKIEWILPHLLHPVRRYDEDDEKGRKE